MNLKLKIKRYALALLCLGWSFIAAPHAACGKRPPVKAASSTAPIAETYVQAARAALERNDPAAARNAAENFFQTANDASSERAEMAMTLKWALLTSGRLNEDFLAYGSIPEMGLMLPISFPAISEVAKPYSCLTMACGLYVPAMSTMICATDREGLDPFSARILTEICLNTGRLSLARRYIAHLPETEQPLWYDRLKQGQQALWAWDSLPYHLLSEPGTTDAWVSLFYPLNADEKAAFALTDAQSRCLLDYYTLLQLLHKRLDMLSEITEAYRASGAKRLPTYVQEALLFSMNYLNGGDAETVRQWRCGDLRIEPDVLKRFEQWFYEFTNLRNGADNWPDIHRDYGDTYAFYFIWDGIAF